MTATIPQLFSVPGTWRGSWGMQLRWRLEQVIHYV
jgi:hypothetical protein